MLTEGCVSELNSGSCLFFRKQAILLDSDSDAMDSDEDGGHLGTEVATDSDDDEVHNHHSWTLSAATRGNVSDREEQQEAGIVNRRGSRKYHSKSSRKTRESADSAPEATTNGKGGIKPLQDDSSGQRRTRPTRSSGIGFDLPLPLAASRPVEGTMFITAARLQELLGGPILSDSDDESDDSNMASGPSLTDMAAAKKPEVGSDRHDAVKANGQQQPINVTDSDSTHVAAQGRAHTSAAATIMKQVSIKTYAAAGRITETAHAAAAALPGGKLGARGAYAAVLPMLDPPKEHAALATGATAAGGIGTTDWQPGFPGDTDAQHVQRQHMNSHDEATPHREWAEQGWSVVKL